MPELMAPTYRLLNVQTIPVGNGMDLLHGSFGPPVVLPSSTSRILQICDRFATLEEHAAKAQVVFRLSDAGREQTLQVLRQLVSTGLLTEYSYAAPVGSSNPASAAKPIRQVGIPTCNRAAQLTATVDGWTRHFEDCGRQASILISDDTGDESTLSACLSALHDSNNVQIRYAGPAEKADFIDALVVWGIPRHIAAFALQSSQQCRTGANRNCILLDSVGEPCFTMDDDAVCRLISANGLGRRLEFGGHSDPSEHFVFSDRSSAMNASQEAVVDYLGAHERLLGRPCADVAADPYFSSVDFCEACVDALASVQPGTPAKVVMTAGGYVGDCGLWSPFPFLTLSGARTALASSEAQYRLAFSSREIIRLAPAFVVAHAVSCMGVNMGLDASEILPPFPPSFRSSNGVFNAMAIGLMKNRFIGHLPYGLAHLPAAARSYPALLNAATTTRISDIMMYLNLSAPIDRTCETYEDALRQLGEHYLRIGRMHLPQFASFLGGTVLRILGERVRNVHTAISEMPECPSFWRADAAKLTARFINAASTPENLLPTEFGSSGDSLFRLLDYLRQFGELLTWWPRIWSAASLMRLDTGRRIGRLLHACATV